jgi:hypothetical protein
MPKLSLLPILMLLTTAACAAQDGAANQKPRSISFCPDINDAEQVAQAYCRKLGFKDAGPQGPAPGCGVGQSSRWYCIP